MVLSWGKVCCRGFIAGPKMWGGMRCRPKRPDACILVGAQEDAYVSQESVRELAAHWPGCEIRFATLQLS